MIDVLSAERAIFAQLKFSCNVLTVLVSCIILSFAFCALKSDDFNRSLFLASHIYLLKIFFIQVFFKAPVRDRTADLSLTMAALYRLSYKGNSAPKSTTMRFRTIIAQLFSVNKKKAEFQNFPKSFRRFPKVETPPEI